MFIVFTRCAQTKVSETAKYRSSADIVWSCLVEVISTGLVNGTLSAGVSPARRGVLTAPFASVTLNGGVKQTTTLRPSRSKADL